ncbi:MAG: hypothetical protein EOP19_03105 [Hyphomicrobiales bacterium]|nr:MAG: hypothetical protein EOP19_03105 [Hyphomicrobiales bacterium]
MTVPSAVDVVVAPASATNDDRSYVDWPAIIAGIVIASGISLVLLTFGSAIGLTFTDFKAGDDVDPLWIAIAAGSWLLWVQISSFMAGGYMTGRLRKRHHDATEDESDVRDGAHGLLVWGGALIVGAVIAVGGIGAAASAVGNAAGALTNAASNVAEGAASSMDPNAYFTDMLFRPAPTTAPVEDVAPAAEAPAATTTPAAPAATTETPAATTAPAAPAATAPAPAAAAASTPVDTTAVRGEAGRIFAQSALSGELGAEDRAYLVQAVAANTGLPEAEAEARVDQVVTAIDTAKAKAAEVAEAARKTTVLGAFLVAASLLVSAVGAFWAAQKGGNHRDKNIAFPGVFTRW